MSISPLFRGDVRTEQVFPLRQAREYCDRNKRVAVSEEAVKQIGKYSPIYDFDWRGIQLRREIMATPSIFVRLIGSARTYKLYISDGEIRNISDHFGAPGGVVENAFFELAPGRSMIDQKLELRLRREELLDPECRDRIWRWAARECDLAEPIVISPYSSLPGVMVIPGFADMAIFIPSKKEATTGDLIYASEFGIPCATFMFERRKTYALSRDPKTGRDEVRYMGGKKDREETMNRAIIENIFGLNPSIKACNFAKRVNNANIHLGSINGNRFVVSLSSLHLEKGALYQFKLERREDYVAIICYSDREMSKPLGSALIPLGKDGFPVEDSITLST